MLNLEWFRTFKAIYETGNLSVAAQELFISQPGMSLHLRSLENYTGHRLFDRDTRKMIPTEQATILYNCIIDSMNNLILAEQAFCRNSRIDKQGRQQNTLHFGKRKKTMYAREIRQLEQILTENWFS